jgi:hypothetical protein
LADGYRFDRAPGLRSIPFCPSQLALQSKNRLCSLATYETIHKPLELNLFPVGEEMKNNIPKEATRWYFVMIFCVLLSFFAFAVGPRIGYARETIEHAGLMIALWAPTLGILGVRSELLQRREQDQLKKNMV